MDATTLTLTITSLVVSLLSAVGAAAAAWWTRRASTRQFHVVAQLGLMGRGSVVSKVRHFTAQETARTVAQGWTDPVVGVTVVNTGALPIVVEKWTVNTSSEFGFTPVAESIGPALPHAIAGGASQAWWMPMRLVPSEPVSVTVVFGDGKTRRSQRLKRAQ